jgi:hypothetical protein
MAATARVDFRRLQKHQPGEATLDAARRLQALLRRERATAKHDLEKLSH